MSHEDVSHRTPRTVVVTGGALGIGGGISRRFAAQGDHVVLLDIDEDAAAATAHEIRAVGGRVHVIIGDITAEATVHRLAEQVRDEHGHADVLVNNVGDFRPARSFFAKSPPDQWRQLHEINLWHVFAVTHALLPEMISHGAGSIINISTVEAFRGIPGNAVYSAYNAGVSAFTKSLAVELGPSGIRVNAIAPDLADTAQTPAELMLAGRDPALLRSWLPLGRFGRPEDFAGVVAFLASEDAAFITGQTIAVDGGTLAASGWYGKASGRGWTNMPDQA